ncbi:unnamed protein product [Schistocephalus solidus]|uniref:Uncharacterized protein n=1 Tax=Schistocephalus solidus TaxID=70667 RepID=A0A183TTQ3_SCHSO|nr:unnamed protein product [Schistocephalus solidus]
MFWEGIELPPDIEDVRHKLICIFAKSTPLSDVLDDDYILQRRPSIAAEILSSDVPQLLDFLVSSEQGVISSSEQSKEPTETSKAHRMPFVDNLLSFLDTPETLNPLSASFFSKILINLLSVRAAEVSFIFLIHSFVTRIQFMQIFFTYEHIESSDFFPNILQHLDTSAISDLLVELAQQDNGQQHAVAKVIPNS